MNTTRAAGAEEAENPAAMADAESNAAQLIAGLGGRIVARARAAGPLPAAAAAAAALALLGAWLILRRSGRR